MGKYDNRDCWRVDGLARDEINMEPHISEKLSPQNIKIKEGWEGVSIL